MSSVLHSFHLLHPRSLFFLPPFQPAALLLPARDLMPFFFAFSSERCSLHQAHSHTHTHTRVTARLIIVTHFTVALEAELWRTSLFKDALGCGKQLKGWGRRKDGVMYWKQRACLPYPWQLLWKCKLTNEGLAPATSESLTSAWL